MATAREKLQSFLDYPCEHDGDVKELRMLLTDACYSAAVSDFRDWEKNELRRQAGL